MITLHIIAEGHLLDMGVTMKGYTARSIWSIQPDGHHVTATESVHTRIV